MKRILSLILSALMIFSVFGFTSCNTEDAINLALDAVLEMLGDESESHETDETDFVNDNNKNDAPSAKIDKNGTYDDKESVALYIHTYGELPSNYITKNEAERLGWEGGSVEKFAPGKCIGGSNFGNYEGKLPKKSGRKYYECDIDTLGENSRGVKRIVYSNDGLIYYTADHYETFELLYGEE